MAREGSWAGKDTELNFYSRPPQAILTLHATLHGASSQSQNTRVVPACNKKMHLAPKFRCLTLTIADCPDPHARMPCSGGSLDPFFRFEAQAWFVGARYSLWMPHAPILRMGILSWLFAWKTTQPRWAKAKRKTSTKRAQMFAQALVEAAFGWASCASIPTRGLTLAGWPKRRVRKRIWVPHTSGLRVELLTFLSYSKASFEYTASQSLPLFILIS